jgi:hypothetical protein
MRLIPIRYFTLGFAWDEIIHALFRLMMSLGVKHEKSNRRPATGARVVIHRRRTTHDDDGDDDGDDGDDVGCGIRVIARQAHAHATARTRARVVDSQRPR